MSAKEQTAIETARERADKAQGGPSIDSIVTCPSSRRVLAMADFLSDDGKYQMFEDDPEHCALSLYSTVAQLWEKKTELTTIQNDVRRLVEAAKNLLAESEATTRAACSKYAEPYGNGTDSEHAMRTLLKELESNNPRLKPE